MNMVRWCDLIEALRVLGFVAGFVLGMFMGLWCYVTLGG